MVMKHLKPEGDPYSQLVQEMQLNGYNKAVDIEIGTVIAAPPNIKIRLDSSPIELDKDDLIIAEHLTRHTRIVTLTHNELAERDLGDKTERDHLDTDDLAAPLTSYKHNYIELQFEDVLKVGDRVIVDCLEEQMLYVVRDRARWY
ncbi:DUF2577 domain-containing protein [Bacillus sp. JJ722]|uniref:DUF2577 domain-containing protein n=1 Tax=Bacillus sp. JJ722 TaxID=3122973 RepID=UPI003000076C